MSKSIGSQPVANPLNSFEPRMAKAAMDSKTPQESGETELVDESVSLLLEVLDQLGITPKEACDYMRMDRSKYTRIRTGEARPTWDEVWRLPKHVWLELRRRTDLAKGLTGESAREIRLARIGELMRLLVEVA